ncbi:carbohydrate-binding family 9-like protein [Faecalicatena fissicatena]|nr:carbohydrate-binding family 9-like protein [Faecalicatena fissicatena]
MMNVKILKDKEELNTVAPFEITHLLWGTSSIPRTCFYIGFVPGDGFYVRMVCEEKDPRRTYQSYLDPVYQDSAMEAFLLFPQKEDASGTYLNFEINANGALLAGYGPSRTYRSFFSREEAEQFQARAVIEEDRWSALFHLPLSALERVYGPMKLEKGSTFYCNFYKISESKDIEHYAAYAPITSPVPSFHMPEYFAEAVLV